MGDIVNLKLHRKRKKHAEKETEAANNRARFGRAKDERQLTEAKRARDVKRLDDHKIED